MLTISALREQQENSTHGGANPFIAEVKWRSLSAGESKNTLRQLESKWSRCNLRARYPRSRFEVLDANALLAERGLYEQAPTKKPECSLAFDVAYDGTNLDAGNRQNPSLKNIVQTIHAAREFDRSRRPR
jgi:hypothetical protein